MSNQNFPFIIGYATNVAYTDKNLAKRYKNSSVAQLCNEGHYKIAYALALQGSEAERALVAESYNKLSNGHYSVSDLTRLFGVYPATNSPKYRSL